MVPPPYTRSILGLPSALPAVVVAASNAAFRRPIFPSSVAPPSHAARRGRQDCPHPALSQRAREKRKRQRMAPPQGACGRGCAPVPNPIGGRGLFERSEFRSPHLRDWGKGTRRAAPGRPWFWVLLPKQKDLGVRGRNPVHSPSACGAETPQDPLSLTGAPVGAGQRRGMVILKKAKYRSTPYCP